MFELAIQFRQTFIWVEKEARNEERDEHFEIAFILTLIFIYLFQMFVHSKSVVV